MAMAERFSSTHSLHKLSFHQYPCPCTKWRLSDIKGITLYFKLIVNKIVCVIFFSLHWAYFNIHSITPWSLNPDWKTLLFSLLRQENLRKDRINQAARRVGFKIHTDKTKPMKVRNKGTTKTKKRGKELEEAQNFKYLGSYIDNDDIRKIFTRTGLAAQAEKNVWRWPGINRETETMEVVGPRHEEGEHEARRLMLQS